MPYQIELAPDAVTARAALPMEGRNSVDKFLQTVAANPTPSEERRLKNLRVVTGDGSVYDVDIYFYCSDPKKAVRVTTVDAISY